MCDMQGRFSPDRWADGWQTLWYPFINNVKRANMSSHLGFRKQVCRNVGIGVGWVSGGLLWPTVTGVGWWWVVGGWGAW